jgi:ligand-binding SRPBCC domain-containing protein
VFSNAQVHVLTDSCSFEITGDTVAVFTTQSIALFTTVREKLSSFSLHADKNRFWTDTTITPPFKEETYFFNLSFYDTGHSTISISTRRTNGDVFIMSPGISLQVASPLRQRKILQTYGEPCTLSTPPVGDNDVYYFWSFISDTIKSPFNDNPGQKPRINQLGIKRTGLLWVADTSGKFQSPATPFSFTFNN